jgi:hypothetical protein
VITIFGYRKSSFQSVDPIAELLGKMNDEVVLCEEHGNEQKIKGYKSVKFLE